MTERERFQAIMNYGAFDRVPCWHFGTWQETLRRWRKEGFPENASISEFFGMDHDWNIGKTALNGVVNHWPISPTPAQIIEDTSEYRIVRNETGALVKHKKNAPDAMSHTIEYALQPTRASWERFREFLDPKAPGRYKEGWEKIVDDASAGEHVVGLGIAGLFRMPEFWLGVEGLTYLSCDDTDLFCEILDHLADNYITLYAPILKRARIDFLYIFEDCCGRSGPLVSPQMYDLVFAPRYKRLCEFFRQGGVPLILMDSDGKIDALMSRWLDSGMDIMFPLEIGVWKANPVEMRRRFGQRLRIMGGVNKHVIPQGEAAIRAELAPLVPLAREGGFIPMPDHKVTPAASMEDFRTYVRVFQEMFA